MLRVLFIVLAVVAVALAFVLRLPELYIAAGALAVLALIVLLIQLRHRHEKDQAIYRSGGRPATKDKLPAREEDLSSLGIIDIRPKDKFGTNVPVLNEEPAEPREEMPWQRDEETLQGGGDIHVVPAPARVRKKNWSADVDESPAQVKLKKDVIVPFLQSLLTAVDANTVCVLKQVEAPLKYRIEAIVSKNSYARTQGYFSFKSPVLPETDIQEAVSIIRIGGGGIPAESLGYYLEPIAVRQIAVMPIPTTHKDVQHILLADSMEDGGLGSERQSHLIDQFVHLLATLMDTGIQDRTGQNVTKLRPRREIIADEMSRARKSGHSLALALVHLQQAEHVAEKGAPVVRKTEQALESRLKRALEDGRVERFGELTYGVFYIGSVSEVERWAISLQRELATETGLLEGGVSIGIAMLDERHESADELRADATEALREAFETGACTIIA